MTPKLTHQQRKQRSVYARFKRGESMRQIADSELAATITIERMIRCEMRRRIREKR